MADSYSYFPEAKLSTFFKSYQQQSFAQMFAETALQSTRVQRRSVEIPLLHQSLLIEMKGLGIYNCSRVLHCDTVQ